MKEQRSRLELVVRGANALPPDSYRIPEIGDDYAAIWGVPDLDSAIFEEAKWDGKDYGICY